MENVGTENVNPLSVSVESNDPYITMMDGDTFVIYALAGEIRPSEEPIVFAVAGNAPDQHLASFTAFSHLKMKIGRVALVFWFMHLNLN